MSSKDCECKPDNYIEGLPSKIHHPYCHRYSKQYENEIDRLTAELATCRDAVNKHQQDLYDENEKIVELRAELETNAKVLARQTDLAREAEIKLAEAKKDERERVTSKIRGWARQNWQKTHSAIPRYILCQQLFECLDAILTAPKGGKQK